MDCSLGNLPGLSVHFYYTQLKYILWAKVSLLDVLFFT